MRVSKRDRSHASCQRYVTQNVDDWADELPPLRIFTRRSNNLPSSPSVGAGADGIRTDKKGNLYLAAHGVAVYTPQGKLLGKIQPPVNPRNLAFGDKDFRTLYMIGNTLYRVRLKIPGSVQY